MATILACMLVTFTAFILYRVRLPVHGELVIKQFKEQILRGKIEIPDISLLMNRQIKTEFV